MHKVGDYVVYPMHGGAVITAIHEDVNDGEKTEYYVLKILCSDLVINIPAIQAEKLGLREVSNKSVMENLNKILLDTPDVKGIKSVSWNRRQQMYIDHLKTGDIFEVARTYKMLWILDVAKRISVGERRLLKTARRILQSEIMLIEKIEETEADEWLSTHTK